MIMNKPRKIGDKLFAVFNNLMLVIMALVTIYPLWYTLMYSLSAPLKSKVAGLYLIPEGGFHLETYVKVISQPQIQQAYSNTFFVVIVGTLVNITLTTLTAYSLSKKEVKGNTFFTIVIIFTMLFNGGMIPTFLVVRNLKLINSLWALIIPSAISAYNVFILRNFFKSIPDSIEDSAKIDGASVPSILVKIILPLSVPGIATISLFYAVGHWNDYMQCMIYINDSKKYVLQLVLRNLILSGDNTFLTGVGYLDERFPVTPESLKMATVVVTTIPIMLVYPFIQKYFVKGVMLGSLKG